MSISNEIRLQGIIKLGQARDDKLRRVSLKVDGADIVFALQVCKSHRTHFCVYRSLSHISFTHVYLS